VSNTSDSLSDDEVRRIALLVETLDRSTFDYLQVDMGNLKVTIGKGNSPQTLPMGVTLNGAGTGLPTGSLQGLTAVPPAGIPTVDPALATPHPAPQVSRNEASAQDETVTIMAPLMGRFYTKPEPGAAPFVSVGSEVNADTTVGVIEVMKVFNAVPAGVSGVVTEICVQDAEFIEYRHILFRVRPAATAADPVISGAKGPRKEACS